MAADGVERVGRFQREHPCLSVEEAVVCSVANRFQCREKVFLLNLSLLVCRAALRGERPVCSYT